MPQEVSIPPDNRAESLTRYFHAQVDQLLRPIAGALRHPYLNPGGSYLDQLWDWDSYWVATGLFELAATTGDSALAERVARHARGCLLNFFEHQGANGNFPILLRPDNTDVFNCRAVGETPSNPAKPIFAQFAELVCRQTGDSDWLLPHFPKIETFFNRWESRHRHEPTGLFVWGTDVAIGVDNDPTTYGRPFHSSANLLLNCLLYQDFSSAQRLATTLGKPETARRMAERAKRLAKAIRRYCWDEQDGFFYTVDVLCEDHRASLIPGDIARGMGMSWKCLPLKVKVFTGFLPLWCGIANESQAQRVVSTYLTAEHFRGEAGLRTVSAREPYYDPETESSNPSNWLGPTWTIASYLIWRGLKHYRFEAEAETVREQLFALLSNDLDNSGSLHEHYHPESGRPNFNHDFISWNLLVINMLEGQNS